MDLANEMKYILSKIHDMPLLEKVEAINTIKLLLHEISPFNSQPVDCIIWVPNTSVLANDYNPNSVAPPEMELLKISIMNDGYTQPIVTMDNGDSTREVIDGFHRNRCGKECPEIQEKVMGFLPVVTIKDDRKEKGDRIAATIRHNRARGKHKVESMSDIVLDLKRRNWSTVKIAKELGMDDDEVLRLSQISGLVDIFKDEDFAKAWVPEQEEFEDGL